MPCCQKDHDGWWKRSAKDLGLSIGAMMDLLSAGKMLAWETGSKASMKYQVKMKLINEGISLQNRIILCKAVERNDNYEDTKTQLAHAKLTKAYRRAHRQGAATDRTPQPKEVAREDQTRRNDRRKASRGIMDGHNAMYLLTGFFIGITFSLAITTKPRR